MNFAGTAFPFVVPETWIALSGIQTNILRCQPSLLKVEIRGCMPAIGATTTEAEVAATAAYFSGLTPRPWIRVIETYTVPETTVAGWMYVAVENGARKGL